MAKADERVATGMAVFLLGDAVFDVVPNRWLDEERRRMQLPSWTKRVIPVVKVGAAFGLLLGRRRPALGRWTSNGLLLYFVLALGAHARVRDHPVRAVPATGMLAWSAATRRAFPRET